MASAPSTARAATPPDALSALGDWSAALDVDGPLERPAVAATLRARGQSVDAKATLLPFAKWPLADLDATMKALDLSAIAPAAPVTSLSGTAHATTSGIDSPAAVRLDLRNDVAGRYSDGKLPLRSIGVTAQGRPNDPSIIELRAFAAELGTAADSGGRIAGSGEWHDGEWSVDAALDQLEPSALDARMATMKLSGPLVASSHVNASAPATSDMRQRIDVRTDLVGRIALPGGVRQQAGPVRAVELHLDASVDDERLQIRRAEAISGGARASLTGQATRRDAQAPWQVAARLGLTQFDPTPWWQGSADSPWRDGPHRLNATVVANLTLPPSLTNGPASARKTGSGSGADASRGSLASHGADLGGDAGDATAPRANPAADRNAPLLAELAGIRGQVTLNIAPSLLAGVAIDGNAKVTSVPADSSLQAEAILDAAGNAVSLKGKLATRGSGADDRWQVDVKAPALAAIAPLMRLATSGGAAKQVGGSVVASGRLEGRWPAFATDGKLTATSIQVGADTLASASARWQLGTAPDAALDLQVDIGQAAAGAQRIESASVQLHGTAAAHTLQVRARAGALPPEWVDRFTTTSSAAPLAGTAPSAAATATSTRGTALVVNAEGGLIGNIAQPSSVAGWRGRLAQLDVTDTAPGALPWMHVDPVDIEVNASGPAPRAALSASRASVLGAGLRWSRVAWQGGAQPSLDAQAELEPLAIAPVLARLQPAFGWSGDLVIAGKLNVHTSPRMSGSFELSRQGGDLRVSDNVDVAPASGPIVARGSQALGLTQLRVAADVKDGVWQFSQALTSANFGVLNGVQTVKTSPQALWPEPQAPLQGTLSASVANLVALTPWIPAGWRLAGKLETHARIGGTFGAPEYTGDVVGSQIGVRNLLEGVNLSEGDLEIALRGSTARIEHFQMSAGKGTVKLEGTAAFGSAPVADLRLTADRFEVLGRVDRRIVVSGDASLRLDEKNLGLDGAFRLDEGLVDFTRSDAPTLADDVTVLRARARDQPADAPPAQPPVNRNVAVNVRIDLGDKLRIKGRGIDTGLGGELRLTQADGRLSMNGSIGTIGGTYKAYGQNLAIDRGVLIFSGPLDNPRLDIEATRPDIDTRVGVQVTGFALTPRVRLFSDNAMSDTDRISWLVLGRAPDSVGGSDAALLQRAAMGLLSGGGQGDSNSLIKSLGLDDVSLGQETTGDVKQTVVSLGKQLSKRWYVGYARSLNGTAGGWQLIYRIAQRFTVRAQAGADSSVDLIWVWRSNDR